MAMGRSEGVQDDLMATWAEMPRSPGHAFYDRLQELLQEAGFDAFVEGACKPYYAPRMGAPSLPPGRYFRMHMIGYFEGIDSERGIAWRCADSFSLRDFLRLSNRDKVPDHSWLSRTRSRLPHEAHEKVFAGPETLRVTPQEMAAAWKAIDPALREALSMAAKQIRGFAKRQMPKSWKTSPLKGLTTGQLVRPLSSVGCYVPSGRHPLPSTLLMTVIPAQVAGVARIVVVSPKPAIETLAAAHLLEITEFYRLGGAHAIAALAYGTASLPRVDKIVGPGNLYVTAAKRLVAFDCAIDMLAGPTEIVVTSEHGEASCIASDLVAQAEHDPEALAIFVTTCEDLARSVMAETKKRCRDNTVAHEALTRNGVVILARSIEEARRITNRLAPEHLTIDAASDLEWVENAGSVFVGRWSTQPMGDYISGPNHTLPTGGMARVRGGLSVNDFVKLITVQEYSTKGIRSLGPPAVLLAEAEGLLGHAEAIHLRWGGRGLRRNKTAALTKRRVRG